MQQFTVPQFIDVEPKIIGPITTRQFLIILVAAFIMFIVYKTVDFNVFLIVGIFILILTAIIAFAKINGRPFHFFLLNFVQTMKKPSIRVWDHRSMTFEKEEVKIKYENTIIKKDKDLREERLAELSLVADTKGRYRGDDSDEIILDK